MQAAPVSYGVPAETVVGKKEKGVAKAPMIMKVPVLMGGAHCTGSARSWATPAMSGCRAAISPGGESCRPKAWK